MANYLALIRKADFVDLYKYGSLHINRDMIRQFTCKIEELPNREPIFRDLSNFANAFDSTLWEQFLVNFGSGITSPLREFGKCLKPFYFPTYFTLVKAGLVAYVFFAIIGLVKAIPKHEYENIENGSSDWSEGGEQYRILSKNHGIVLAEKNYLPVDKRGNVNVLVVRRFWCW